MYEISGGAVLKYRYEEFELEKQDKAINEFENLMKRHFKEGEYTYGRAEGLDSFSIVAIKKESYTVIVEIFKWIAENMPGSIGSLDIHDIEYIETVKDKDIKDIGKEDEDKIIVYKLKEGNLIKIKGPFIYAKAYFGD